MLHDEQTAGFSAKRRRNFIILSMRLPGLTRVTLPTAFLRLILVLRKSKSDLTVCLLNNWITFDRHWGQSSGRFLEQDKLAGCRRDWYPDERGVKSAMVESSWWSALCSGSSSNRHKLYRGPLSSDETWTSGSCRRRCRPHGRFCCCSKSLRFCLAVQSGLCSVNQISITANLLTSCSLLTSKLSWCSFRTLPNTAKALSSRNILCVISIFNR